MKNILITGGAGYIGIHTSSVLLEHGFNIVIVDSFLNSSKISLARLLDLGLKDNSFSKSQLEFFEGDVRDLNFLRKIFHKRSSLGYPIEAVIHFAGLKSVSQSILNPDLYWDVNVYGTIQLLKVMREYDCMNFLFSSSATVYSPEERSPLFENSQLKPSDPYGKTKLIVENLLKDFSNIQNDSFNYISLRYFNPIGAHPSSNIGESQANSPTNLFPHICKAADSKIDVLEIYGNDYPTLDGTCVRDFIHIMDLAEGHLAAINYLFRKDKSNSFNTFNLGTGKGTSVLELVKIFENVNNLKINFHFSERRLGDKPVAFANCDLAKKILNWKPKKNIGDMCRDGWNWQIKNPY